MINKQLLSYALAAALQATQAGEPINMQRAQEKLRRNLMKRINGPSTHTAKQSKQSKNQAKASRRKNRGK